MKIVFCASEVVPFAKTGGLADVCGSLPLALDALGEDVAVFMPHYLSVNESGYEIKRLNRDVSVTTLGKRVQVYFIDHPGYFSRPGLYGEESGDYEDNLDRFQFFCQKTLEVLKQLDIRPDIMHVHDWQTALLPVYLKTRLAEDHFYAGIKTMLSIHNLAYQGVFPKEEYAKLHLPQKYFRDDAFEFYGKVNFLKAGIIMSDLVATVSPEYAREIQTEEYGCGLEGVLSAYRDRVVGILNGVDYAVWNPETDSLIPCRFSGSDLAGKVWNKAEIQRHFRLPERPDVPLWGMVSRLSHQKGIDLLVASMDALMAEDVQVVVLGVGEEKYHRAMKQLVSRFPGKFAVELSFNERLAHGIYAGSDFFLMPSVYEPCGLSQMISLKYGTIPLVYATGGLVDTVRDVSANGNGFVFTSYTPESMAGVFKRAVVCFRERKKIAALVQKAFCYNFSWEESAKKYIEEYRQLLASD